MGFLDNLIRSIESGGMEKSVLKVVDGFESKLDKAVGAVDKAAANLDKPTPKAGAATEDPQQQT